MMLIQNNTHYHETRRREILFIYINKYAGRRRSLPRPPQTANAPPDRLISALSRNKNTRFHKTKDNS